MPHIAPHAPLLSETAQPNGVSSADKAPLAANESMDPKDFDVNEMAEKIQEGTQEEDVGFDVVENITSDFYQ